MPDRSAAFLLEIEEAIQHIGSFVETVDQAAFLTDRKTSAAVAMYLLVIGESAGKLSEEVRDEAPEIPWVNVVSLRNRIAHGYSSIDRAAIWRIVGEHLPTLKIAVRRLLAARGEPPP